MRHTPQPVRLLQKEWWGNGAGQQRAGPRPKQDRPIGTQLNASRATPVWNPVPVPAVCQRTSTRLERSPIRGASSVGRLSPPGETAGWVGSAKRPNIGRFEAQCAGSETGIASKAQPAIETIANIRAAYFIVHFQALSWPSRNDCDVAPESAKGPWSQPEAVSIYLKNVRQSAKTLLGS
jgi:hypothetical protein